MSYVISMHSTENKLRNQLYYPACLFDLPPAHTVSKARRRTTIKYTYSAISDTKRAFTMKGSLGSLPQPSVPRPSKCWKATHLPLPSILPYPCCRVSMTGTTSEFSVSPFFSSSGTRLQSLSTLIIGRQYWLRVRWKWRIPTLPK